MFLNKPSPQSPQRIISLVPSITELLYDLNLSAETVGVTKFCVHPKKWHATKARIGGTKNIQIENIKGLKPDLIIASKEENIQEQVEILANFFPVYLTDVCNYDDAIKMILNIGKITSKTKEASLLVDEIHSGFNSILAQPQNIKTAYFIWKDPYMTVGGDTFINDMLNKLGLNNMYSHLQRYPQITLQEIAALNPELILLSSEPYPFKENHIIEIQKKLPYTNILLVDGEMFSWYGSRMKYVPTYFNNLLRKISELRPNTRL